MIDLGRIGLWSRELRNGPVEQTTEAVAELESLGYGAIWMPAGAGQSFFPLAGSFLGATNRLVVASGILSIWTNPPAEVSAATADLEGRFPGRFLLGLGVSHAHVVERLTSERYERPLTKMREYLDALDSTARPVPPDEMTLAALGPKMLELSSGRTAGAHPYFVPPEHTATARSILGPGPLLAPEQAVVLETDAGRARDIARRHTTYYLKAPNYVNNLRRLGFGDPDLAEGGSDKLVDAIVAWGDLAAIGRRIRDHLDAGADHVCLQVLPAEADTLPLAEWRTLSTLIASF